MNTFYKKICQDLKLGEVLALEVIQTLWSNYGQLIRLKCSLKTVIIKHIKLPEDYTHPYGWNNEFSHKRKIKSYKVEVNWYKNFSQEQDNKCYFPKALKCINKNNEFLIIMEDLKDLGFDSIITEAKELHLKTVLRYLANFHAKYLGKKSDLLWEEGTYWHLRTRPRELEALEDKELKANASKIDKLLRETKYQTLVHGDAKLANFCFSKDGSSCAAVDFQYVGHGCGIKDVVLFISSAIKPQECEANEKWLLDFYFDELKKALKAYQKELDSKELINEWRNLYPIAWADFLRFLKGWKPNHFKINKYSEFQKEKAFEYLFSLNS